MEKDQVKGMLDRAIAVMATMFLAWCVKRGYMGESDAAQLLPAIVLLPSMAWAYWNNRKTALLQKAANVVGEDGKKTVIAASPELAAATPKNQNIIPNTASPAKIAAAVKTANGGN